MRFLLFILPFLISLKIAAQTDFVITNVGDTIYGKIVFPIPDQYSEFVKIKNENGKQEINSNRIVLIMAKGMTYMGMRLGNRYKIMQQIIPGYLSLFKYRNGGEFEFGNYFLYKATSEGIPTSPVSFRKSVADFLKECPDLSNAIIGKKYNFKDLDKIVMEYNASCLREVPKITPFVEGDLKDLKDLQTLLVDVLSKIESEEPIPDYLKKALKEYTRKDINSSLIRLFKKIDN